MFTFLIEHPKAIQPKNNFKMKKTLLLIFLTCCFLSCSQDDADNKNPLEGRWYYEQTIHTTTYPGGGVVSSTRSLGDCEGDSYYDISDNHVELKEFLSCENWNTFQGTFDSENNEIIIANSNEEFSEYNVQLEDEKLVLRNETTSIVNGEEATHTITQICTRRHPTGD